MLTEGRATVFACVHFNTATIYARSLHCISVRIVAGLCFRMVTQLVIMIEVTDSMCLDHRNEDEG